MNTNTAQKPYQVVYPTLTELQSMSAQDIFNRAAKHLLKQGKEAVSTAGSCMYRGPQGTACAVGALIPQDLYTKSMEGHGVGGLLSGLDTPDELRLALKTHERLLKKLQFIHDDRPVNEWPVRLADLAESSGLQMVSLEGPPVIPMGASA